MQSEPRQHRAPAVLLPYQQRWVADRSPVKIAEKSRRVGLTWASAAESALEAAAERGMDVWYVGYNKEMAEEFILDTAEWSRHFGKAAAAVEEEIFKDGDEEILTYVIRFASGYRVTALSSRPSNLRGKQGLVILDEAAFHEQLAELLKAAIALLMWGGRVEIISTHDGIDNAFAELLADVRAGKKPYSIHRITLDDALADGLYKRICLRTGKQWSAEAEAQWRAELVAFYGDAAEEELFCVPRSSGGAYLARSVIEARMFDAPVFRLALKDDFVHASKHERESTVLAWCEEFLKPALDALPKDLFHYFGEDFGRSGDLTVIAPVTLERLLLRRVPFVVELRNVPFEQQGQVLFYLVDRLPNFMSGAMDARGNGQYLAEVSVQRYGARVEAVALSEQWYMAHMPRFKAAFEDAGMAIPKDADVLQDLRQIQLVRGVPKLTDGKRKGTDGKPRHGDAAIALAMAHYATNIEVAPIELLSTGERRAALAAWENEPVAAIEEEYAFGVVRGTNNFQGF